MNLFTKTSLVFLGICFSITTVSASSITVTSPNGGEKWSGSQTVTWSSSGTTGFVNVIRCTDLTCTATTSIVLNIPDTGSTTFDTTGLNENAVVYIEDVSDASLFDSSDAAFTLDNSISSCNAAIISNNASTTVAKLGDLITVSFDTCEAVSSASVTILGRTVAATNTGGSNWSSATTSEITDQEGLVDFSINYTDLAGNSLTRVSTANSSFVRLDRTLPSVTITLATSTFSIGTTATTTFLFNEAVLGFDNSDITVSGGSVSTVSSLDGGVTWTALFTPFATTTLTTNVITVTTSGVADSVGNVGAGTSSSTNYSIDTAPPSVSSIVFADSNITLGETSLVAITFTEPVTGFSNADFTRTDYGTLSDATSTDGGITWTTTFTPLSGISSSLNAIAIGANFTDMYGNTPLSGTTSPYYILTTLAAFTSGGGGGGGSWSAPAQTTVTPVVALNQSTSTTVTGTTTVSLPLNAFFANRETSGGAVLGATTFKFTRDLRMKSTGNEVMELQKYLTREGYFKETPTKYFGVLTRKALIEWQRKNGLPATGYFGPMSRAIINK